jgi:branched-chain amino acid transport system permease protein
LVIVFVLFIFLPWIFPLFGGYTHLATEVLIWSIFALGFNLVLGYTGLPSFGHGAYFGVGAYMIGLIQFHLVKGLWIPLLLGTLSGGLAGAIVGAFLARKRGIYFALLTIAFSQLSYFVAFRWDSVTGGEDGLTGIDRMPLHIPGLFSVDLVNPLNFYFFVYAFFVVCTLLIWMMVHSPFGRALDAIKQNEIRARCLGYNTARYKWAVFTVSGVFSGLAGSLNSLLINGAFYSTMHWTQSGNVVIMSLLGGGLTNFFGPVLGAVVFIVLRDLISTITEHWMLIYGLLFVFILIFMPEGILGILTKRRLKVGSAGSIGKTTPLPENVG